MEHIKGAFEKAATPPYNCMNENTRFPSLTALTLRGFCSEVNISSF